MKWISSIGKNSARRKENEERTRTAFLLEPVSIVQKEMRITRWLEHATWLERWNFKYVNMADEYYGADFEGGREEWWIEGKWRKVMWLDIEETAFQKIRDLLGD